MHGRPINQPILLFLRGVEDRQKILAVGAAVGGITNCNFPSSQSLFFELACAGAVAGGAVAGAGTGNTSAVRGRRTSAGESGTGVSACLRLWDYLVRRDLLLDLQIGRASCRERV